MGLWLTNWSNIGPKIMAVSLPWVHKSLSAAILLPDWDTVNGLAPASPASNIKRPCLGQDTPYLLAAPASIVTALGSCEPGRGLDAPRTISLSLSLPHVKRAMVSRRATPPSNWA